MADDYTPTTAPYINPALPAMIRGLYRADLREKSIQNMLDLAADLVQELIELRAKRAEWEAEQGETDWEYECRVPPFEWTSCTDDSSFCPNGSERRRRRRSGPWLPVPDTGAES